MDRKLRGKESNDPISSGAFATTPDPIIPIFFIVI
jgi:hypothetical protein